MVPFQVRRPESGIVPEETDRHRNQSCGQLRERSSGRGPDQKGNFLCSSAEEQNPHNRDGRTEANGFLLPRSRAPQFP